MFQKIDCIRFHVPDLDEALIFYREKLGLKLVWKVGNSEAGLKIGDSDNELVLVTEELEQPEIDFMVDSVHSALEKLKKIGGKILVEPFEIKIGKCSVVEDPWNNRFVILDRSKGLLKVYENKNVIQE